LSQATALLLARGDRVVKTTGDARVSIHHCAAVALRFGKAGVLEFSDAVVFDADVVALRGRVRAVRDDTMPVGAARISIACRDGRKRSAKVAEARGSLARPLSDADIEAKFRELARDGSPGIDSARAIEAIRALEQAADLRSRVSALSG
jgi:2-methylcitrate dehydratase PrpD